MHTGVDNIGYVDFHAPILKAADGLNDNFIGTIFGFVFVKFDMPGAFNPGARVGGDQLGVIAFRHFGQVLA